MDDSLVKDLEEIGLPEKEARVYLASLELGPATAQQIAAKAIVNRPTTYIMIESLTQRGLMSSYLEGKKKYFSASIPNRLVYIIQTQKREILEKENRIKKVIELLQQREKNITPSKVEIFNGINGLMACQELLLGCESDEIFELTSIAQVEKVLPNGHLIADIRDKICKKHRVKSLCVPNEKSFSKDHSLWQSLFVKGDKLIEAEMVIYREKIFFNSYGDNQFLTILITDNKIATTLKTLFDVFWQLNEAK